MTESLVFREFQVSRAEHQLEPDDRAMATYLITNSCDCLILTDIVITHPERTNVAGEVVLSCEPSMILIPGQLAPHEERRISLEIVTQGELPGRHALRVKATFASKPVRPTTEGLFELTVTAD